GDVHGFQSAAAVLSIRHSNVAPGSSAVNVTLASCVVISAAGPAVTVVSGARTSLANVQVLAWSVRTVIRTSPPGSASRALTHGAGVAVPSVVVQSATGLPSRNTVS